MYESTTVLRFAANSQASAPRTSVHVCRTHQEGASEQFGVEAIGVTEVAKDDSDTHQRVSVIPVSFEGEITFARCTSTCCDPHHN